MATPNEALLSYLNAVQKPFKKLARLEFLQPDNTVAFALDNNTVRGYQPRRSSKAFIQSGNLSVNLQNGQRRQADITLANIDNAFDYNVNNIWFGQRVRLSMGIILPNGEEFYLPQGVFYIKNPEAVLNPQRKTITFPLVDKWAYLDGSLFGTLDKTYRVLEEQNGIKTDIFRAIQSVLRLSKLDFSDNAPSTLQIDNVSPVYTTFYDGKTYPIIGGGTATMTNVPYDMNFEAGGNFADVILELAEVVAAWIGYDPTGALRLDASQDDINDSDKPIQWNFSPQNSNFLSLTETVQNSDVRNDIIIVGEGLNETEVWGRATNFDPQSDTNVNLIGKRTFRESKANYWNAQQCVDLAQFYLKRQTVLQKSVTIESSQLFHLQENNLVTVQRTDKPGAPVEKHLVQSISLPIAETGAMSISCISVNDLPNLVTTASSSETA